MVMTLDQIKMFIAVAEELNFSKAANDFYVTQSTASRQIAALENEWGFPLFFRTRNEVRLTHQGSIMLTKCKDMIYSMQSGLNLVKTEDKDISGHLLIGVHGGLNSEVFETPTSEFMERFPNVEIDIERTTLRNLREKLEEGFFDVVFVPDFDIFNYKNVVYNNYYPAMGILVISEHHPLFSKKKLTLKDFSEETILLPTPDNSPYRKERAGKLFQMAGFSPKGYRFVANEESMLLNIKSGKYATLLYDCVYSIEKDPRYRYVEIPQSISKRYIVIAWKRDNYNPAVALYTNKLLAQEQMDPGIGKI